MFLLCDYHKTNNNFAFIERLITFVEQIEAIHNKDYSVVRTFEAGESSLPLFFQHERGIMGIMDIFGW